MYQLNEHVKQLCLSYAKEQEQQNPQYCDVNGKFTICQLFENDYLDYITDMEDIPENLSEIDWTFMDRKFNLTNEELEALHARLGC